MGSPSSSWTRVSRSEFDQEIRSYHLHNLVTQQTNTSTAYNDVVVFPLLWDFGTASVFGACSFAYDLITPGTLKYQDDPK